MRCGAAFNVVCAAYRARRRIAPQRTASGVIKPLVSFDNLFVLQLILSYYDC